MSQHLRLSLLLLLIGLSQSATAIEFPNNIDSVLNIHQNNGQLEEFIVYIDKILSKAKQEYGNQKDTFAYYLAYKAGANEELGYYEEALVDFQTTLKIYEKNHSSTSPELVEALMSLTNIHLKLSDYNLAKAYLMRALEIQKNISPFDPIYCAYIYNFLFSIYEATGEYTKGLEISKKALKLQLDYEEKDFYELISSYSGISAAYKGLEQYENAISMEKKALDLQQKHFPPTDPLLANRFNNLAALYSLVYRRHEALLYYQKSLEIVKKNRQPNHPLVAIHLNNLAGAYRDLEQFKMAEKMLLQAVSIFKVSLGDEHPNTIAFINNIGGLYERMGKFKKAKDYYSQAIILSNKVLGKEHPYSILFQKNLANCYQYLGNYKKSLDLNFKVLELSQTVFGETSKKVLPSYNNIANCYLLLGADFYPQGLDWIKKSIRLNATEPIDIKEFGTNLSTLSNRTFKSNTQFRRALKILSKLQQATYQKTNHKQFLVDSYKSQKTLAYFIQQQQNEVYTKKDKLKILGYSANASSRAIGLIEELIATDNPFIASEAITFAEYNKSAILSSVLQGNQAFDFGDIPDSLKTREKTLKKELSSVKKKIIQAKAIQNKDGLTTAKNELINIQLAQDRLRLLLEKNYPKYNALKNEQKTLTTSIIQDELLEDGSALLEYCVYDSAVYVIVITKTTVQLQRLPIQKKELKSEIKNFRKSLSNYSFILNNKNKALALYTLTAHRLYQTLITPIQAHLTNIKHLIIVPDNDLGHIPFEALLSTFSEQRETDYKALNYLLNDYSISYSYSASLSLENKHYKRGKNNSKILGFAATYTSKDSISSERSPSNLRLRKTLKALPAATEEVLALQKQFLNSDFFFGEKATEANFKAHAPNYSILHLAMHGIVNHHHPLLSSLAFTEDYNETENNFLEAHEISNLQLNNDLVVLSACETGYGEFEQGEGIISLARSFMYAGTPSLVVSLWEVNDFSTAIIMQLFYQYLTDGMTKDKALRQAKLDFIQRSDGIITHPAFWSPFILLGDNQPIAFHQTSFPWKGGLLGILAIASIFLVYLKNRSSKKQLR